MTATPTAATSLMPDGSYPAKIVAVELTLTTEAVPAWELTFLIRDAVRGQQFVFPLTLPLDTAHVAYVAGVIEILNPTAKLEPLPHDTALSWLIGRRCLLIIASDIPIGIGVLPVDADADSQLAM